MQPVFFCDLMENTIIPKEIYTHLFDICILDVGLMKLEVVVFFFDLLVIASLKYILWICRKIIATPFFFLRFCLFRFLIPPYRCLICNEHMDSIQIGRIQAREYQHSVMKIEKNGSNYSFLLLELDRKQNCI